MSVPIPPMRKLKPSTGEVPLSYYGPPALVSALKAQGWHPPISNPVNNPVITSAKENEKQNAAKTKLISNQFKNDEDLMSRGYESDVSSTADDQTSNSIDTNQTFIDDRSINHSASNKSKEIENMANNLMNNSQKSSISEGVVIRGDLEYSGVLVIDGVFEGELKCTNGNLILERHGVYIGNIKDHECVVSNGGRVQGNIDAKSVVLNSSSVLTGNINSKSLVVNGLGHRISGYVNITPNS